MAQEEKITSRWPDEHTEMAEGLDDCSREDLLGLIEFYKQALEVQGKTVRQLVIAKVCRWLANNAHEYLAHKGNCKFCAQRRRQELKELVKQIKEK